MRYKPEYRHYRNSVLFQRWNYRLYSAWEWTAKFIRSYNMRALLLPTISPATFNSDCKQNRRVRFVATLTLWLFLQVHKTVRLSNAFFRDNSSLIKEAWWRRQGTKWKTKYETISGKALLIELNAEESRKDKTIVKWRCNIIFPFIFFRKALVTQWDERYFSVCIADILYESCCVNLLFSLLNNIRLYSCTSLNGLIVVNVQIMALRVLKACATICE